MLKPPNLDEYDITVFLRLYNGVFPFQNNPKDLDLSCKKGKIGIIAKFHMTDLVI